MPHSHALRSLAACAATAAVLALTACDSSGSGGASSPSPSPSSTRAVPPTSASATPTVTASASASSSSSSTSPSSPSSPSSSARPPAVDNCTNAQLRTRSAELPGGDSHGGIVVIFVNTSSTRCSLYGYPGAAAVDRAGTQFEQAARTTKGYLAGSRLARISLAPGASASSAVEGDNGGGDECLRGHTLLVTPPNTTRAVRLSYLDAYACHFQVHPVVAGVHGGAI